MPDRQTGFQPPAPSRAEARRPAGFEPRRPRPAVAGKLPFRGGGMNMIPRYNFLPGTEITLFERPMVVTGNSDHGYKVAGRDDGITTIVPFAALVEQLKLPGARLDTSLPATGGRLKQTARRFRHLGGPVGRSARDRPVPPGALSGRARLAHRDPCRASRPVAGSVGADARQARGPPVHRGGGRADLREKDPGQSGPGRDDQGPLHVQGPDADEVLQGLREPGTGRVSDGRPGDPRSSPGQPDRPDLRPPSRTDDRGVGADRFRRQIPVGLECPEIPRSEDLGGEPEEERQRVVQTRASGRSDPA